MTDKVSINNTLAHRINYMRVQIHMLQEQLAKMKQHAKNACEDMSTIVNNFQLLGLKAIHNPDLKETTFDKMNSLKTVLDHYDDKRQEYQIMVIQYQELVQMNNGKCDPSVTDIRKIDDTNNYVGTTIHDMLGQLASIVAKGVEPPTTKCSNKTRNSKQRSNKRKADAMEKNPEIKYCSQAEPEETKMEEDEDFLALMDEIVDDGDNSDDGHNDIEPEPPTDESLTFEFQEVPNVQKNENFIELLDIFEPGLCLE